MKELNLQTDNMVIVLYIHPFPATNKIAHHTVFAENWGFTVTLNITIKITEITCLSSEMCSVTPASE